MRPFARKNRTNRPWRQACFKLWIALMLSLLCSEDKAITAQIAPGSRLVFDSVPLGPFTAERPLNSPSLPYRTLRIWLPPDYHTDTATRPLLVLLDGQNLFDGASSFSGEWQVDESLSALEAQGFRVPVVVGVDNGGPQRIAEYTPSAHPEYGGGEAAQHLEFLTAFVLPHVQATYRVSTKPVDVAIGGSSIGAIMALYAVLHAPESFGTALVFSPAFWFLDKEVRAITDATIPNDLLCWGRMGCAEGRDNWNESFAVGGERLNRFALGFLEAYYGLRRSGWPAANLEWSLDPLGEHKESWWSSVFPLAVRWWLEHPLLKSPLPPAGPDK
ncbi:MAG: hypothetical protein GC205_09390 [Bacteroidetes bacterium]|nr:hypothetical protein [Bacteroidota bacterium]